MRERSEDICFRKALIEINRRGVLLHELRDRLAETAGPAADGATAGI
jgi:hypothetical protein